MSFIIKQSFRGVMHPALTFVQSAFASSHKYEKWKHWLWGHGNEVTNTANSLAASVIFVSHPGREGWKVADRTWTGCIWDGYWIIKRCLSIRFPGVDWVSQLKQKLLAHMQWRFGPLPAEEQMPERGTHSTHKCNNLWFQHYILGLQSLVLPVTATGLCWNATSHTTFHMASPSPFHLLAYPLAELVCSSMLSTTRQSGFSGWQHKCWDCSIPPRLLAPWFIKGVSDTLSLQKEGECTCGFPLFIYLSDLFIIS